MAIPPTQKVTRKERGRINWVAKNTMVLFYDEKGIISLVAYRTGPQKGLKILKRKRESREIKVLREEARNGFRSIVTQISFRDKRLLQPKAKMVE